MYNTIEKTRVVRCSKYVSCLKMNKPNLKSQTKDVHLKPEGENFFEDEQIITNFKKLCRQDKLTYMTAFREMVGPWFVKHHLDIGGNPQRQILSFVESPLVVPKCKCGRDGVKFGLHLPSKREFVFCQKCFSKVLVRYDVGVWSWKK
jgi:hypothetical protein